MPLNYVKGAVVLPLVNISSPSELLNRGTVSLLIDTSLAPLSALTFSLIIDTHSSYSVLWKCVLVH